MRLAGLRLLILLGASTALANETLDSARRHTQALELDKAKAALKQVSGAKRLSRSEAAEFFELSALVAALKGESAQAKRAFTDLLVISPGFKLSGRLPPKVTTPFAEAKAIAREVGALELIAKQGPLEDGWVTALKLTATGLKGDLVKEYELTLVEDGVSRTVRVPVLTETVAVHGREVKATVLALGANDGVLFESEPLVMKALVELKAVAAPAPDPVVAPSPQPEVKVATGPTMRPLAYGLIGVGAACAVAGLISGGINLQARTTLASPPVGAGGTSTLTRAEALAINERAMTSALIANVLFVSAGTLLGAGLVTWLLGNRVETPKVAVAPRIDGFSVGLSGQW